MTSYDDPLPPRVTIPELAERYDAIFFDAFGVLIRSDGAVRGAQEALDYLERQGVPYFVLTNDASRQIATAGARYRQSGLAVPDQRVITSGSLIAPFVRDHDLVNKPVLALAQGDALEYVLQSGARVMPHDTEAPIEALFVCDLTSTLQRDLEGIVSALIARIDRGQIPKLVLPNPDLLYPQSASRYGLTAGSIAAMIEAILAERYVQHALKFIKLGKPHEAIYLRGLELAGVERGRAVMIGDQLATDVRGALDVGLKAALVVTGLSPLEQLAHHPECRPDYLLDALWI